MRPRFLLLMAAFGRLFYFVCMYMKVETEFLLFGNNNFYHL